MKIFFSIAFFLVAVLMLLTAGCATTSPQDPAKVAAAYQTLDRIAPYIKSAATIATRTALVYAERDSGERVKLTSQIHAVASALNALLASKDFSPSKVTAALKVKEKYVDAILGAVGEVYAVAHDDLVKNEQAGLAVEILKALAAGVEAATN